MIKADWARRPLATGDPTRLRAEGGWLRKNDQDDDKENCDLWRVKNGRNLSTARGEQWKDFEAVAPQPSDPKLIEMLLT